MAKTETVRRATGRDQEAWYSLLDEWGAPGRPYKEIAAWLMDQHGLSKWWAQKLIVEYEQDRGIRPPGIRPSGTFEVSASKTVAVPASTLLEAFVNPARRRHWLTDGQMRSMGSGREGPARFEWADGRSRVTVSVVDKGRARSMVTVTHDRLPNADEAQAQKTRWRQRLTALRQVLES